MTSAVPLHCQRHSGEPWSIANLSLFPHASTPAELNSDGEEATFTLIHDPSRCEGDRGSYSGTGAGESKSNPRKTEEVA